MKLYRNFEINLHLSTRVMNSEQLDAAALSGLMRATDDPVIMGEYSSNKSLSLLNWIFSDK